MGILLLILKIIGITFLVILLLILFILALLLFVPFRYSAKGSFKGKLQIEAKVTYLLHLIHVVFTTDIKHNELSVKILFFELLGKKKKAVKNEIQQENSQERLEVISKEDNSEDKPKETPEIISEKPKEETPEIISEEPKEEKPKEEKPEESPEKTGEKPKESQRSNRKKFSKDKKTKTKSKKADKSEGILDKIKSVVVLIKENEKLISFLFKQLKRLFKHVLPGQFRVNLKLGLGDPAALGELLGAAAIIRSATNLELNIVPYFDEKIVEAEFDLKGRVRLFTILWIGLTTYFNKDMRKLIKKIRRS